tara:strand:+ start:775 stop:930 length:156 start_codon:yes stop_codon:yes gene_type:complete
LFHPYLTPALETFLQISNQNEAERTSDSSTFNALSSSAKNADGIQDTFTGT